MAETVALSLEIETGKSIQTLGQLENKISRLKNEFNSLSQANFELKQHLADLEKQWAAIPDNLRGMFGITDELFDELRQTIKENNLELQKFRLDTQEAQQMASDINHIGNEARHTEEAFSGLVHGVGEIIGAFMLLGGDEDSSIAQTVNRIQNALGVVMAFSGAWKSLLNIQKIYSTVIKKSAIFQKAQLILIRMTTIAQKMLGRSTVATSTSFKAMRTAIMATGIGALVVAVGLLIANFDKIMGMFKGTDTAADHLNKTLDKYSEGMGEAITKTDKVSEAFRKLEDGTMTEKEALFVYNDTLGDTMGHYDNIEDAEKRFKTGTAGYLEAMGMRAQAQALFQKKAEVQAQLAAYEMGKTINEFQKILHFFYAISFGWLESLLEGQIMTVDEIMKKHEDRQNAIAVRDLKAQQAGLDEAAKIASDKYDLLVEENNLKTEEDDAFNAEEDRKQRERERKAEKRRQARIRAKKAELKAIYGLELAHLQKVADEIDDTEIDSIQLKAEKEIEIEKFKEAELLKNKKLTATQIKLIEFNTGVAIDKINKSVADKKKELEKEEIELAKAQAELLKEIKRTDLESEIAALKLEYQEKFELAKGNAELEKALAIKQAEDIAAINETYADEAKAKADQEADDDLEKTRALRDAKLQIATDGLNLISQLTDVFAGKSEASQRKAFKINKAVSIAQALISTYQSAVSSYNALAPIIPVGPVLGAIAAGIAVASGLANVAKIKQTKFEGGSGSSPGTISPPSIGGGGGGGIPNMGTVTNTSTIIPTGDDKMKVFVTETDISNTQNKVAVIEDQSTY